MKFDFSKSSDLQNKLQINKLDLIMKNVLHATYQLDSLHKKLNRLINDLNLQKQVDDYYEETPPQTDQGEQTGPNDSG